MVARVCKPFTYDAVFKIVETGFSAAVGKSLKVEKSTLARKEEQQWRRCHLSHTGYRIIMEDPLYGGKVVAVDPIGQTGIVIRKKLRMTVRTVGGNLLIKKINVSGILTQPSIIDLATLINVAGEEPLVTAVVELLDSSRRRTLD